MESRILAAREKVKPLGAHTSMGHLHAMQKWKDLPFLRENEGMLPPFIICVGDRRRVLSAPSVLNLKNYAFIDQEAAKIDPVMYGRDSRARCRRVPSTVHLTAARDTALH